MSNHKTQVQLDNEEREILEAYFMLRIFNN